MRARNYQQAAFDGCFRIWLEKQSALIVMATGLGKSFTFAQVAKRLMEETGKDVLVFAHREELVRQAKHTMELITGHSAMIEMGQEQINPMRDRPRIIISTVQSLSSRSRLQKFNPERFCLLVTDETHHAPSISYMRVINHFRSNPNLKFLGVTATPERSDKLAMGAIFDDVAINYGIQEAVNDGWLVRPKQLYVNVEGIDLTHVRTTAGDLNQGDLSKIMEEDRNARAVVDAINHAVGDKKTLVFAASVLQADKMCVLSNMFKPGSSRFVCGTTPKDQRHEILKLYSEGKITRLFNCGVFTEGFDSPSTQVVAVARPTKSKSLYIQILGRALRPSEAISHHLGMTNAAGRLCMIADSEKPEATILDFCGNSGRHKLVSLVDVLGGTYLDAIRAKVVKKAKKSGKVIDVAVELEKEMALVQAKQEAARKREADRHAKLESVTKYTLTEVDPFDVLGVRHYENTIQQEGLTEKQRIFLEKQGIPCSTISKREAGRLIGEVMRRRQNGLPTFKQEAMLHKLGHTTTPDGWRTILDNHFQEGNRHGLAQGR